MEMLTSYDQYESIYTILTSDEVAEVIRDFHLLIHNTSVPPDYTESSAQEYLEAYSTLCGLLSTGQRIVWKEHWALFMSRALTMHPEKCRYGNVHTYRGRRGKSADFEEPCPIAEPFVLTLWKDSNGKQTICKTCHHTQFPEYTVGIRWMIPTRKTVFSDNDIFSKEIIQNTDGYADFLLLKSRIGALTVPLKLVQDEKILRPGIRLGKRAVNAAKHYPFFTDHGLRVAEV